MRVYRIGDWSLHSDEIYTVWNGQAALKDPGDLTESQRWHERWAWTTHPLLQWQTRWAFSRWGSTPLTARIFPLLSGLCALAVFPWWIGRLYGPRAGWVTLVLLAFCPWHIVHSQYARYESSCFLFGGLMILSALSALRSHRRLWFTAAVTAGLAALASHLTSILPVLVVLMFPVIGREWKRRLLMILPAAALCLLVVLWMQRHQIASVIETGFSRERAGDPLWKILASIVYNMGLVPATLAFAFSARLLRVRSLESWLLVCAFFAPVLAIGILSPWKATGARFLSAALPALLFLAVMAVEHLVARWPSRRLAVGLLAGTLLTQAPLLASNFLDGQRYDYRSLSLRLSGDAVPSDVILCDGAGILDFYLGWETLELPEQVDLVEKKAQAASARVLVVVLRQRGRLVYHSGPQRLEEWLAGHAVCRSRIGRRRLDDLLYRFEVVLYEVVRG